MNKKVYCKNYKHFICPYIGWGSTYCKPRKVYYDTPNTMGCTCWGEIEGLTINFRELCGLQTVMRKQPENPPKIQTKTVLYGDGNFYLGWQRENMPHIIVPATEDDPKWNIILKKAEKVFNNSPWMYSCTY